MSEPRLFKLSPAAPAGPVRTAPPEPLLRQVLGDILRRARQRQARTLKDVALDARVSMPYLSEVERGLKEASSEVLAAICQALDLTVADLLALAYGELAGAELTAAGLTGVQDLTSDVMISQPGPDSYTAGTAMLHAA